MTTALASLTANYTDSEGEEHLETDENEGGSPMATDTSPQPNAPIIVENVTPSKPKVSTLVSYHDDTVVSDDDREKSVPPSPMEEDVSKRPKLESTNEIELPPEPAGRCSHDLQEKIRKLHDDVINRGLDMNIVIQQKKEFRNPSIYEKLIQFCGINEFGTNYRPEVYDPLRWGKSSYYDELAKVQKVEMDAREKERKERTKVEVISGTAKKPATTASATITVNEDEKKRKSKWDQVGLRASANLTTASSGTKGTVISAFGSLNKKPRV